MCPRIIFGLFMFCVASFNPAYATAKDDFQSGKKAFRAGQYEDAILSFEKARQQGMRSPSVYYNIAVSYFKLEDYGNARVWFKKSAQFKSIKYLSEYNLGLIALKLGDRDTALKHFQLVSQKAKKKNLIKLAKHQIRKMKKKPVQDWTAYIQVEYGYDDNGTTVTEEASKLSTSYLETYFYGSKQLSGSELSGISANAFLLDTKYGNARVKNLNVIGVQLIKSFQMTNWQNALSVAYNDTKYGDRNFQNSLIYEASTKYELSPSSEFRIRYRYYDIDSRDPAYYYLEGSRQRLRLEYRQSPENDKLKLYYELETNDRENSTTKNYSPVRNTFRGRYTLATSEKTRLTGDMSYRISDYNTHGTANPRKDKRTRTKVEFNYRLDSNWFVSAEYTRTINNSDNPSYNYRKNVLGLSIAASF